MTRRTVLRGRGDEGSTLLVAVMVAAIAFSLCLVILNLAVTQERDAGVDRQRSTAVAAAEAGVDASYVAIQNSGTSLPCAWPATGSAAVRAYPDQANVAAAIRYFDAAGGPISCPVASGVFPASAVVDSRATTRTIVGGTTFGNRAMQANVKLRPVAGNGFNRAIFANGDIVLRNNHVVYGDVGPDADLYSNRDIICPTGSNQSIAGSIYAQGNISFVGECSAGGQAWAKQSVSLANNQTRIAGGVIGSRGNVNIGGPAPVVGGTVKAGGAVSWPAGCSSQGKCFGQLPPQDPPAQPFPILRGDTSALSAWQTAGYTVVQDNSPCTTLPSRIIGDYALRSTPTLVRTTCAVALDGAGDVTLRNNLAIFADGGISSRNRVAFQSDSTTTRQLYWVVPYDAVSTRPCSSPAMSVDGNFSMTDAVNLLMYSPCDITVANRSTFYGQIFSGSNAIIENNFDLHYRPLPVYGVDPNSLPTLRYDIDIVYKREVK